MEIMVVVGGLTVNKIMDDVEDGKLTSLFLFSGEVNGGMLLAEVLQEPHEAR